MGWPFSNTQALPLLEGLYVNQGLIRATTANAAEEVEPVAGWFRNSAAVKCLVTLPADRQEEMLDKSWYQKPELITGLNAVCDGEEGSTDQQDDFFTTLKLEGR